MSQEVELTPVEKYNAKANAETAWNPDDSGVAGTAESELTTDKVGVEGTDNPAFSQQMENVLEQELPPMTFVDFLPRLLEEAASGSDAPVYEEFGSVLEQANQWLNGNTDFQVMKLESFMKRFGDRENGPQLEEVLHHESCYGINRYLRGLRLWLAPRQDPAAPVQEIGYITTLPDTADGDTQSSDSSLATFRPGGFHIMTMMPSYVGMKDTIDSLNKFLKKKPLPGTILNIESLKVKYDDTASKSLDSERMCWTDCGRDDRVYLYGVRVYYVVGKPAFEVVGYHDEVPICQNNWELVNKLRFCPFTTVVQRAKNWLKKQKGIRVVNMQTVDALCDRTSKGECRVHNDKTGTAEVPGRDTQYARILRVFYVVDTKNSACPYENVNLSTRLFIPTRRGDWGKNTETFSKTLQRVIKWLQLTGTPLFGVETVTYPFTPDSYGTGIREESSSVSLVSSQGKYYINTVRLYFPCDFEEPDPKLLPQPEEEEGWWMCTVS